MYLISLYVDDILVAGSNLEEVNRIKRQFTKRYEMKDLGELNYLKITRTEESIKLDQSGYVRDILEKYGHLLAGKEGKVVNTPMERDLKPGRQNHGLCQQTNELMLVHSLIRILWERYCTWHSIQGQISHHMQWEY